MHKAGRGLSMKCERAIIRDSIYRVGCVLSWDSLPSAHAAGSCLSDLARSGIASSNAFRDGDSSNSPHEPANPPRRFRGAATPRRLSPTWKALGAICLKLGAITARWEEIASSHASRTSRPRSALCDGARFAALRNKRLGRFTPRTPSTTLMHDTFLRSRNTWLDDFENRGGLQ